MRSISAIVTLFLLPTLLACGGGGGGGAPPGELTGPWLFYLTDGGIDDDPMHMTLVQTGTDVSAELTCDGEFPEGTGTYVGGALSLTFDLGGGDSLMLSGTSDPAGFTGTYDLPSETGTWRMETTAITLDCAFACEPYPVTQFVSQDFTDLSKIQEISLFRSAAGHDYSDACESCRSMKHYYNPMDPYRDNGLLPIYAPVDGMVISVQDEGHGASPGLTNKQVRIRSTLHPEYTFILFHVDLDSAAIAPGAMLSAGDLVGHAHMWYPDLSEFAHDFDIAVRYHTLFGERYVSFFDVMTDVLFASYQVRGVPSRAHLVLTEAMRDADPLTCIGETFTSSGTLPVWFILAP
ncbi:MAG: M23 family metallopeptidase [Planctomycetota bacterium]